VVRDERMAGWIRIPHEYKWLADHVRRTVGNVDCTLCLESPKINPHIPNMKKVLAPLMNITEDDISIKATTNETLGYVGREEGVNAYAVALISKN